MNILGLENDLSGKEIIALKTLSGLIKLNDFNINNINNKNYCNVEILTAEILNLNQENYKTNKIRYDDKDIISISFFSNLLINLNINGMVSSINNNVFISHSFIYTRCEYDIYTYPINLDLTLINHQIYFSITYAFLVDKFEIHFEKTDNNKSLDEEHILDFSNYRYIDINKEFM